MNGGLAEAEAPPSAGPPDSLVGAQRMVASGDYRDEMKNRTAPATADSLVDDLTHQLPGLRRFAAALAGDDGDDLVQDAYVAAAGSSSVVQEPQGFLRTVIRRKAADRRRRIDRRRHRERVAADSRELLDEAADERVERAELLRALLEELERLPDVQRRTLTLRFLEGLAPGDVAERMGVHASTVRSNTSRGLQALRERMDARLGRRAAWAPALCTWGRAGHEWTLDARAVDGAIRASGVAPIAVVSGLAALALGGVTGLFVLRGPEPTLRPGTSERLEDIRTANDARTADGFEPAIGMQQGRAGAAPSADPVGSRIGSPGTAPARQHFAVDRRTGEPVADIVLTATTAAPSGSRTGVGGGPVPGSPSRARSTTPDTAQVAKFRTNADGSFQLDLGPDVHEATLRVREPDGTFLPHDRALELPLRGPLELDVGPTYSFDFGDSAVETSELVARFIEGERTVDSAPLRRNSRHPWARFGPEVAALTSSGPFRVEVASAGGFAAGRAKVTRTVGIEPEPLRMELAPLGRLELRFESRPSDPRPIGWLRIERIDGAERRRLASLDATRPVDAGRTVLDLTPGAYEWTYGSRSGAFAVAAEETTRVVVETPPDRFAASIEIDRSALPPGLAVETAFALGEVGSLGQEFILTHPDARLLWHDSPTYDFTLASGSWSARCIPHAATDPGSRVPSIGAAFEPELLTPNTPNVTCRLFVDDPIRTASLRVTGTDASGEPARVQVEILRDAGGRVRADGLRWSQTGTPIEIPVERRRNSVLVVVRCEGHEARVARLNAGSSHEITMSRGNTEPVFVVDATHGAPAVGVGVWINGSSIGPTDERGIALFRGTEIPVDFEVYTGRALRTIVGESPSDTPILYVR